MQGGGSPASLPAAASGSALHTGMQPSAGTEVTVVGAAPSPPGSGTGHSARQDSTQPSLSVSTAPVPGAQSGGGTKGSPWQFSPSAGW